MENSQDSGARNRTITLQLAESDFEILEKFRGDLTPDAFISALLRMVNSGTVRNTPGWARELGKE